MRVLKFVTHTAKAIATTSIQILYMAYLTRLDTYIANHDQ